MFSTYNIVLAIQALFLTYMASLIASYLVLFGAAAVAVKEQARLKDNWLEVSDDAEFWPPITVILPAYNEELVIVECVRNTLALNYPSLEVVVVCDGPKDRTFEELVEAFELVEQDDELRSDFQTKPVERIMGSYLNPYLRVILKQNGGKADALNVGLNAARTPLVCCCDADTLIEPDALKRLVWDFKVDASTIAASGVLMLTNGVTFTNGEPTDIKVPRNWLAAVQVLEYIRAFFWGRMSLATFSSMLIVSGAFGLFSRQAMVNVGGYDHGTVGEDMDLIVRLHRYYREHKKPYKIAHNQKAVAWTEAPESLAMLRSQRMRWQRGLCEVLTAHWKMPFERNSGLPGKVGYLYFLFFEGLAPIVELGGYVCLCVLLCLGYHYFDVWLAMLAFAVSVSFLVTMSSVYVQQKYFPGVTQPKEIALLLMTTVPECFILKPLTSYWRVKAMIQFLQKKSARWDPIARKGFNAVKSA